MTDWLTDTPVVARPYCPDCEPTADPSREILDVRWCSQHEPQRAGADDPDVVQGWISGTADSGGEDNKAFCDLLHRGKR